MTAIRLVALLDGTVVDPSQPIVRADDQGVMRGDGVFDATLAKAGRAHYLDAHLERLAASAGLLQLPAPDEAGYRRAVDAILAAWDWDADPEAVLRLVHTRGPEGGDETHGWVTALPIDDAIRRERAEGVKVMLLNRGWEGGDVVDLPWLLPGAKSLSYGINMAAKRHAKAHGADDVVFVSPSGALLEGPTSSVVLDLDGVLVTPPLDGILRSITVAEMLEKAPGAGLDVDVRPLHRDDLVASRGAWLLSSGRIIARITHADDVALPTSPLDAALTDLLTP